MIDLGNAGDFFKHELGAKALFQTIHAEVPGVLFGFCVFRHSEFRSYFD